MKKVDWTKPVQVNRPNPLPLRVLCTDAGGDKPVVCIAADGTLYKCDNYGGIGSVCFEVGNVPPPPRIRWVNVFGRGPGEVHTCKSAAMPYRGAYDYQHTLEINIDTGETKVIKL
jgi:hypothetical protein